MLSHEEPDPAVCLLGCPYLDGDEAEGAFQELEGMLDVESGEVGAPELVEGQSSGARLGAVRRPPARSADGSSLAG
jgi:hypothetical protein